MIAGVGFAVTDTCHASSLGSTATAHDAAFCLAHSVSRLHSARMRRLPPDASSDEHQPPRTGRDTAHAAVAALRLVPSVAEVFRAHARRVLHRVFPSDAATVEMNWSSFCQYDVWSGDDGPAIEDTHRSRVVLILLLYPPCRRRSEVRLEPDRPTRSNPSTPGFRTSAKDARPEFRALTRQCRARSRTLLIPPSGSRNERDDDGDRKSLSPFEIGVDQTQEREGAIRAKGA